ncbi:hypothetical protein AGLY_006076 [Aphis glycines]|uniref:Uncharacterized protein n=1 Tax=Aphis glycines TaxID=307491 RepID=A0A6G0TSV8_APHGL|nr:hypothetical protein AGLY_006076 [Aphis glycines]
MVECLIVFKYKIVWEDNTYYQLLHTDVGMKTKITRNYIIVNLCIISVTTQWHKLGGANVAIVLTENHKKFHLFYKLQTPQTRLKIKEIQTNDSNIARFYWCSISLEMQKHINNNFHQQSGQQATNKIRINRVLLISTFKKLLYVNNNNNKRNALNIVHKDIEQKELSAPPFVFGIPRCKMVMQLWTHNDLGFTGFLSIY